MSKLTDQQKIEIVEKYKTGKYNCSSLGLEYKVHKSSINQILRNRNIAIIKNVRKYTLNEKYFDNIDSEEKAYFLGLLYADGYNHVEKGQIKLKLQESDRDILDKLNNVLSCNKPLYFNNRKKKNKKWQNTFELQISSKHISERLVELGCVARKSLVLEFPSENQVPNNLLQHFMRGYIDGDGCITFSGKYKSYTVKLVSTVSFCDAIKHNTMNTLNVHCTICRPKYSIKRNTTTRFLYIGGNIQVEKFLNWLYNGSTVYLKRKYNLYQKFLLFRREK